MFTVTKVKQVSECYEVVVQADGYSGLKEIRKDFETLEEAEDFWRRYLVKDTIHLEINFKKSIKCWSRGIGHSK